MRIFRAAFVACVTLAAIGLLGSVYPANTFWANVMGTGVVGAIYLLVIGAAWEAFK